MLLETQHPRLAELQVRGRLLDLGGGVRTRSQQRAATAAAAGGGGGAAAGAAAGTESHSRVSARVKILTVLAEMLADLQVRVCGGDGESRSVCRV